MTKELCTVEDLASIAGVTPATVRWWVHVGRAPRNFKIAGGRRTYFARADVIAWLEQGRAGTETA
ncbi:helix-turn-helix transcriptional regulator [Janibacter melonis]|uniref:helix-turn-helix transcriptional regulator n=1 Tax=Janibacter melonis TaxID=262209 RepID=UPI00174BFEAB|nr:helix-turn-helix domain-containing protein [Janibacter melonis]